VRLTLANSRKPKLGQNEQDRKERITRRRWLIGMGIAGLMAMSGVAGLLIELLIRTHS
jgi:hypothetical protein